MSSRIARKPTTIETAIRQVYDVDAMGCEALTVEWAAGRLAAKYGPEYAAAEWRRLNEKRARMGKHTYAPHHTSALHRAFFAG